VVGDVLYVLDYLETLNESDPLFHGSMDMSRIGMYGHSFGGAATLECMLLDGRIDAGLTLDGVFYRGNVSDGFTHAFCMLLAEKSFAENTSQMLFDSIDKDVFLCTITGSTHYAYTDVGLCLNHLLPLIPPELLGFGSIEPKRMVNITRSYIRVFFQVYLMDYPMDLLLDLDSDFAESTLRFKI
jgi:hypothetical protein